jgi:aerobic-type carbon monoxide dehydrogenase small subunit (CoxS/CutS family)
LRDAARLENPAVATPAAQRLVVNGNPVDIVAPPGTRLLDVLRDMLGLTGAKEACGRGECGACTVLISGRPVASCIQLADTVEGAVTTIEGLADAFADLRQAFADHGAFQCGFCTPGQIVRAAALLDEEWPLSSAEREAFVRHRMSGNICRCTGYSGIVDAILQVAAVRLAGTAPKTPR